MNPFYEKKFEKPHINNIQNLNFPAHLHDAVEIIYVKKAEYRLPFRIILWKWQKGN